MSEPAQTNSVSLARQLAPYCGASGFEPIEAVALSGEDTFIGYSARYTPA